MITVAALALAAVRFVDVTASAGVRFQHTNGAFGKKYLPETMGSGVAFFDFDGDGDQDLLFVNGMSWPERKGTTRATAALYRNRGDGTFEDVTAGSGFDREAYGMGVAIADYDGDSDPDVYVTCLGPNLLFRNEGRGKFTEVGRDAGVADSGFGSSATWLDHDRDGDVDLFVLNYVQWTKEADIFCTLDGKTKSYCTPESYKGASPLLYRNDGKGRFTEVTRAAGLYNPNGKGLGVTALDFDDDGWLDLAVANDTQPNNLYRNNGNGTFNDVGVLAGIAFAETGVARGAMGIDAGDYDRSGRPSLVIGNFSNEMVSLYHNESKGFFIDVAPVSEVGRASLLTLAFGAFFFDFDLDGALDIFIANGHVETDINAVQKRVTYAQPPHLFRNLGGGKFAVVTRDVGSDLGKPIVARGAAYGDIDGDGDLDVVVSTNGGPARLFRNDGGSENDWIAFKIDPVGARVRLTASGRTETRVVQSATGYCSQNQSPVVFGLGAASKVDKVEVTWPDGRKQTLGELPLRRVHTLSQPK